MWRRVRRRGGARLRQAEKDAGARAEEGEGKEKTEEAEELEDVEASEGDLVEAADPSL
jgi:hypothetical protein